MSEAAEDPEEVGNLLAWVDAGVMSGVPTQLLRELGSGIDDLEAVTSVTAQIAQLEALVGQVTAPAAELARLTDAATTQVATSAVEMVAGLDTLGELTRQVAGLDTLGELTRQVAGLDTLGELTRQAVAVHQASKMQLTIMHEVSHLLDTGIGKTTEVISRMAREALDYGLLARRDVACFLEAVADHLEERVPGSALPSWLRRAARAIGRDRTDLLATGQTRAHAQGWLDYLTSQGSPGRCVSHSPRKVRGPNPRMDVHLVPLRVAGA
jgi:hypothetical protein